MNIKIKLIDDSNKADINILNEPFKSFGRMIPSYVDEHWQYRIEYFDECTITIDCFPNENYSYDDMKCNNFFIGAYDDEKCIALAIMQHAMFKYMYLHDLKVNHDYRRCGRSKAFTL